MPKLLAGKNGVLALKVSKMTSYPICYYQMFRYPDGELYFRLTSDVEGEDVIIFNSLYPDPEKAIFEIALMSDALVNANASSINCVIPYFAYSRSQNRMHGEALPISVINRILKSSGIRKVYTVDFHIQKNVFDFELQNITAMRDLGKYFAEKFGKKVNLIAPDENAVFWAEEFAKEVDCKDIIVLRKMKLDIESFVLEPMNIKIGKAAVIVDDIVNSGATVVQAAKIAKKAGCEKIYVACTHAILSDDALQRIFAVGVEGMIATDTILSPVSYVSVAKNIADAIIKDFS
ncbi:MAG: ribose-phosphate diphosphokinase [Archaeoglobales archaeon]|nr:ribose-phosphate diphosphokinase [Archaeoglobales archaeon]